MLSVESVAGRIYDPQCCDNPGEKQIKGWMFTLNVGNRGFAEIMIFRTSYVNSPVVATNNTCIGTQITKSLNKK